MSTNLPWHEWLIISLFCSILAILAGMALWRHPNNHYEKMPSLPEPKVTVLQVKVEGAVANPGNYRLPLNATLKELLKQAHPLPQADLSQLKWRRKLRNGQTIYVPERVWITIYLEGAVKQTGPVKILSGTRWQELADQLEFLPEADLKSIRKKQRFLQDGELIIIASKRVKNKKTQKQQVS